MLACLSDTLSDKQFSLKCGVTTVSFLSFCFCRALIFFPLNIEKIQNEHISDEAQVVDHNLRSWIREDSATRICLLSNGLCFCFSARVISCVMTQCACINHRTELFLHKCPLPYSPGKAPPSPFVPGTLPFFSPCLHHFTDQLVFQLDIDVLVHGFD